jgi:hypothetical protein
MRSGRVEKGGAGASPFAFALAPLSCLWLLDEVKEMPRMLGKKGPAAALDGAVAPA